MNLTAQLAVAAADLSVLKRGAPDPVVAGQPLTYSIEVVNAGPVAATTVRLTDTFSNLINNSTGPSNAGVVSISAGTATCSTSAAGSTGVALTCNYASVPVCTVGVDCPIVTVVVRPGGDTITRTNTANVISSDVADPNLTNNAGSNSVTLNRRSGVALAKSATPSSVAAGQVVTFVVTATNRGPSSADAATITDTLPDNLVIASVTPSTGSCSVRPTSSPTSAGNNQVVCNLGTIGVGAQQTLTITARPTVEARGLTLTNNAVVAVGPASPDTDASNNSASAGVAVTNPVLDLLINTSDSPDPVAVGDSVVYTIVATNNGPSAARNGVVTDVLPTTLLSFQSISGATCTGTPAVDATTGGALVCNVGNLAMGGRASFTVTMKGVLKGTISPGNAASVTSDELIAVPASHPVSVSAYASSLVTTSRAGYFGSTASACLSQVRMVLRESPVRRTISLNDRCSR